MKILFTGATGFLGRRTVERLAPHHQLRLLLRPTASRERFPAGVEFVTGDVTDRASVAAATAGVDAIVHAAALVKIAAPGREFDRVNIGGLENVLAAGRSASVSRILYVSSFIALGPTENGPGGELDESAAIADRRWINDYERTKAMADRQARFAIENGWPLVVAYPGVIYGPGELTEGNIVVRHLLDLAGGKLPALLGRPERRWSYVFVDDVAAGLVAALERAPVGGRYVLGGENVTQAAFYALVDELGGIRSPARRMPDGVARLAGAAMKGWAALRGTVPQLTPDLVEIYRHDWAYDSSRAVRELGYAPRSLRDGLGETLDWLREIGRWRS
ncbi:MAG: NAD-dependent epimerase/dehydratase family protein [Thermoanaerobaculia bacterium]